MKDSNLNKRNVAIIAFALLFFFNPFLAIIAVVVFVIYQKKKRETDGASARPNQPGYRAGKELTYEKIEQQSVKRENKADYRGVDREIMDKKFHYTTSELYGELLNRKTDYRGVDKNLL